MWCCVYCHQLEFVVVHFPNKEQAIQHAQMMVRDNEATEVGVYVRAAKVQMQTVVTYCDGDGVTIEMKW